MLYCLIDNVRTLNYERCLKQTFIMLIIVHVSLIKILNLVVIIAQETILY